MQLSKQSVSIGAVVVVGGGVEAWCGAVGFSTGSEAPGWRAVVVLQVLLEVLARVLDVEEGCC
jgi:hypothetical protein